MNFQKVQHSEEEIRYQIKKKRVRQSDWIAISFWQVLSEDFIREFSDNVHWLSISINQKLSEEFMEEFQKELVWHCVSKKQHMSRKFKYLMYDKISIFKIKSFSNPKEVL